VQLGLDLQYPSFGPEHGRLQFVSIHRRSPGIPTSIPARLLAPFAMHAAFPRSDYYGASAPPIDPQPATGLARPGAGCPRRRAVVGGSHVHFATDRPGRCPALPRQHRRAYAAAIQHGLPTAKDTTASETVPAKTHGNRALHSGPYPPDLSRHNPYGASTTGSLSLHLLTSLAGPERSGSARPSRRCQGRLPPSPAFPGSGCPQLRSGRCDGPTTGVFHPRSVTKRLVAHVEQVVAHDGQTGWWHVPFLGLMVVDVTVGAIR
jgi:hypothetical protein